VALDTGVDVKALRQRLGLSQELLARRLAVSFATVNRWERGHSQMSAAARERFDALRASVSAPSINEVFALPSFTTDLVDQDDAVGELVKCLITARFVTVTGLAGAGKTRLAVEAARRFPGVPAAAFVDLRADLNPGVVVETIVAATGDSGPEPLLIIDGAETALAEVAEVVRRLTTSPGGPWILLTSRLPLGLDGEHLWVPPRLACAPAGASTSEVADAAATRLFAHRARAVSSSFAISDDNAASVAELCRAVDGFPLALESLARWVGTLSIAQIVRRRAELLDDLRPGIAFSYERLTAADRELLVALCVFAGPFGIEDAVEVSGVPESAVLPAVRRLVSANCLTVETAPEEFCYRTPAVLRDYIARCATPSDRAVTATRVRHAELFATLAERGENGLVGPARAAWVTRMVQASADIDEALHWAKDSADTRLGLRMSAAMTWWWLRSGRLDEGRRWLAHFLSGARGSRGNDVVRARSAAATLATEAGDYAEAVEHSQRALPFYESLGDHAAAAKAATTLASAQRYLGRRSAARKNFELALRHRQAMEDLPGTAAALNNLGLVALDDGDLVAARELFDQALVIKRGLGDPRAVAVGLANLSDVLVKLTLLDAAVTCLDEAQDLAADLADGQLLATIDCNRADVAFAQGDLEGALAYYESALGGYDESGRPHDVIMVLCHQAEVLRTLHRGAQASRQLRRAEALAVTIGSEQRLAEVRVALAGAGQPVRSAWPDQLTARQVEILRHISRGATNRAVAAALHLSVSTVERHLANIYLKLGVTSRVEATRYSLAHGLIPPQDASS
jgi:predicted ATPase/DNA-binding CsgD family transcriptional regulator